MKSVIIKISVCALLAGVVCDYIFHINFLYYVVLSFWGIVFLILKRKIFIILGLILIFLSIGALRHNISIPQINEKSIHYYQSEKQSYLMKGIIAENPDRRRDKVNYIVEVNEIFVNNLIKPVNGRILIGMPLYPQYNYGDKLEIKGNLLDPPEFETFSYKNYLSLFKVGSVMYRPRINKISSGHGNVFFDALYNIKSSFEERLNKLYKEPMASFEAGLLTGSRKGIPEELMQNFNITGLTHIIAISGYNISLIIFLISSLFTKVSRNVKVPIIIVFVILFTLFVGASPAVVRASIMGVISVLALWFGRQSQVINALLLSALIMTLMSPQTLLFDVGFQLSFLATLGLIITGNFLEKFFMFLPQTFGLREAFAMTFSAQVFAIPVILLNFKRLSIISPVANVLVVPFIPFAMFFGFISAFLSYLNFYLGYMVSFFAWLVLKWMVFITSVLAKLPFASIEVQWFGWVHLFGYFVFLLIIIRFFRKFN